MKRYLSIDLLFSTFYTAKHFLIFIDHVNKVSFQDERDLPLDRSIDFLRSIHMSSDYKDYWTLARDGGQWLTHLKTLLALH